MNHLSVILFALVLIGCCKEENSGATKAIDCNKFNNSLVFRDYDYTKHVIDSICKTLPPEPETGDNLGHKQNTEKLVNLLNIGCTNTNFKIVCYACIETIPPQSSFKITLDSSDVTIIRYISIRVPENSFMYMD